MGPEYILNHNPYYHLNTVKELRCQEDACLFLVYKGVVKPISTVPTDHRFLDAVLTFIQTDLLEPNIQQSEGNGAPPTDKPVFVVYDPVSDFADVVFWADRKLEDTPNLEVFRVRNSPDAKHGKVECVQADTFAMKVEADKERWYNENYPTLAPYLTYLISAVRHCHESYWSGLSDNVVME